MFIVVVGVLGLVFGILVIVGAFVINCGEPERVRMSSIIVLVFSMLSLFVAGEAFNRLYTGVSRRNTRLDVETTRTDIYTVHTIPSTSLNKIFYTQLSFFHTIQ